MASHLPALTHDIGPLLRRRFGREVRKLGLRLGTGCPHRRPGRAAGCAFCNAGPATPAPPLEHQLAQGMRRLGPGARAIAYLQDHTATHLAPDELQRLLATVGAWPGVVGIAVGTRPDCLPPAILDVLAHHASQLDLLVELGLQTADDRTLRLVSRGHTVSCFVEAVQRLHERELRVCAHVILGLPTVARSGMGREDETHASATARLLASLAVEAVKIHNCHVLRGTWLAELFRAGLYQPPGLTDYVRLLAAFLDHLPWPVEIHRLVGEARPESLLVPAFTAHKAATLAQIRAALAARGCRQGRLAGSGDG